MKKMIILLATIAMTTLFTQANVVAPSSTVALETEVPTPTEGDTNGTKEETPGN